MDVLKYIVKVSVAAILAALLLPTAIGLFVNATIPNADPTVTMVFQILVPTLLSLGVAISFLPPEIKERVGLWANPYTMTPLETPQSNNPFSLTPYGTSNDISEGI